MKRLIIIFIFLILFPLTLSASDQSFTFERKNPFLAGVFSWFHPGLGQFYAGDTKKATIFWLTENVLLFSVILNIADIKISGKRDFGFDFSIRLKQNPSNLRIVSTIGLGLLLIAIHIYNIIDAIKTAQDYNRKLFAREFELSKGLSIDAYAMRDVSGIKIMKRF